MAEGEAEAILDGPLSKPSRLADLLRRPGVGLAAVAELAGERALAGEAENLRNRAEIEVKYAGYIERDQAEQQRVKAEMERALPETMSYTQIEGLSNEVVQRLEAARPRTLGQAANIPGITPAALSLLLVHAKRQTG